MPESESKIKLAATKPERGEERLWGSVLESIGDLSFAPLIRYIRQEWSVVKAAPGVTVAAMLVAAVVVFSLRGCSDSGELATFQEQIAISKEQVAILTGERNTSQINQKIAEDALAPWKTLANSQFPEKPINERMDLLFSKMQANMQEQFKQLGSQIDRVVPPPKSLKERLRICLDSIDTRIMEALKTQPVSFEGKVDFRKVEALRAISEEQDVSEYFTIMSISEAEGVSFSGTRMGGADNVKFSVTRKLIEP